MATERSQVPILGDVPVPAEFQQLDQLDLKYASNLWDALTHCTEPKGSDQVVRFLDEEIGKDAPSTETDDKTLKVESVRYLDEFEMDATQGLYHIGGFDKSGMPQPHPSWKPEWRLLCSVEIDASSKSHYYWQVFRSDDDAKTMISKEQKERDFRNPEVKRDQIVFRFDAKYRMGRDAYDENGQFKLDNYMAPPSNFNYAEHARLGDNLDLKWPNKVTSKGDRILNLANGNKLTYGQINALGGDFFATLDPICLGNTFEDRCQRFQAAYNTLGHDEIAVREATQIVANRAEEVEKVSAAAATGASTSDAYKKLKTPGMTRVLDKEDEVLTRITWDRTGPSYIRMAQLNLDHFGEDAQAAYNAGHTRAMQEAAAGNLEIGYAMNAFADHFLGDCFASGHIRTPRRVLHGDNKDVQSAIDWILSKIKSVADPGHKPDSNLAEDASMMNAVTAVAPDLCSKFMHDEDNSLGLWVRNRRGEQWKAFGDKKLFEKGNEKNHALMKECLQASVDEVYKAFETKTVPTPDKFAAWQIAPLLLGEGNHSALFNKEGHYRADIDDPKCNKYKDPNSWFKWPPWQGYKVLAINLNMSNYFKKL